MTSRRDGRYGAHEHRAGPEGLHYETHFEQLGQDALQPGGSVGAEFDGQGGEKRLTHLSAVLLPGQILLVEDAFVRRVLIHQVHPVGPFSDDVGELDLAYRAQGRQRV